MLGRPITAMVRHGSQQLKKRIFFNENREESQQFQTKHLKTEKTDGEDRILYEQTPFKNEESNGIKRNIELAITIVEQNDELVKMIALIERQLNDEKLKTSIFSQQINKNQMEISLLKVQLSQMKEKSKQLRKMQTLNQSAIPNKSAEMSTTYNTNSWVNEFLNKEDLENLWTQRRVTKVKLSSQKQIKPVKKYTLDLNAAVMSDKMKKVNKNCNSCNIREEFSNRQSKKMDKTVDKTKKTIQSVAYKARQASKRYDLKIDFHEKQNKMAEFWEKTRGRPMSYLRNAKRIKNPEAW